MPKGFPGSSKRVELICKKCNSPFPVIESKKNNSKFCSKKCYREYQKGKLPKSHFKNGNIPWNKGTKGLMPPPWNTGIPQKQEVKDKIIKELQK